MVKTQVYGLVGYPVKHSLSAAMHNAAFRALGINAEYKLFEVKPEELEGFLKAAGGKNIHGLNITVPHKEKAITFLSVLSEEARLIGAVNTVRIDKDKSEGFNTDYLGFIRHIRELKLEPRRVAVIGAGGAAKAICFGLCLEAAKHGMGQFEICIYDIDERKSADLAKRLESFFESQKFTAVDSLGDLKIKSRDLLINASWAGMNKEDPCLLDESALGQKTFVYDLIYNPPETKLLQLAKGKGCGYANGLDMLLYQGAESFRIWTGREGPEVTGIMRDALRKESV